MRSNTNRNWLDVFLQRIQLHSPHVQKLPRNKTTLKGEQAITNHKHYRPTIKDYHIPQEDEYFLIVEGEEEATYDLEHKVTRFGYAETLEEGLQHVEDAQQSVIGMLEALGRDQLVEQILTE